MKESGKQMFFEITQVPESALNDKRTTAIISHLCILLDVCPSFLLPYMFYPSLSIYTCLVSATIFPGNANLFGPIALLFLQVVSCGIYLYR